jgi:hypothetical protein
LERKYMIEENTQMNNECRKLITSTTRRGRAVQ